VLYVLSTLKIGNQMETEEDIKKIIVDILKSSQTLCRDREYTGSLLLGTDISRYNYINHVKENEEKYKRYFNDALSIDFDFILSIIKSHNQLFQSFCMANSDIIISNLKGE
jgi:capsule polysaccharide export protein KpsE/RkpR